MRLRLTCQHCGHSLVMPQAEEAIDKAAGWFADAHVPHCTENEYILVTEEPETLLFPN